MITFDYKYSVYNANTQISIQYSFTTILSWEASILFEYFFPS